MDLGTSQDSQTRTSAVDGLAKLQPVASLSYARELHEQGRFEDAAPQYEAVLAATPDNGEALHLYGVLQFQRGRAAEAEGLIRRATIQGRDPFWFANLGSILAQQGRIDEALAQFDAGLQIDPVHLPTLVRLGNTLIEQRRYEEALDAYGRALQVAPLSIDALCNRGSALRALGRYQEALDTYGRALAVDPRSFESLANMGNVLREMQRYQEALQHYDRALALRSGVPEVLSARGRTLVDLGRPKEALVSFNEAIAARPDFVEALYNSAVALERLGRAAESIERCDRVLALEPHHARALASKGNALLALERHEEALTTYDLSLDAEPGAPEVLCNRGTALRHLQRFDEALHDYDDALSARPDIQEAWCNRGNVLRDLHRYEEALQAYDRALGLNRANANAWFNRGSALFEMFRFEEALQAHDEAIAIAPDYFDAHFAKGFIYLRQGDFARGWAQYEWRLRDPAGEQSRRGFAQPQWRSEEPLEGRTVLVHAEQGYGDTVQFCRYATLLRERGANVLLEVQPELKSLVATLGSAIQVVARGEPLLPFDFHCPLLSLPLAFRTDLATIPAETPYLHADAALVEKWREALGERGRPRVGLAWSGNPRHRNDHNRSLPLETLMPLLTDDVEWISLQKVVRARDAELLARTPLRHLGDDLTDFADTAALIQSLDVVIAVDTAVAHLAGALNRPVWILLPHLSEWRWLDGRADSPWYPGARLFRQSAPDDWSAVIEEARTALRALNVVRG